MHILGCPFEAAPLVPESSYLCESKYTKRLSIGGITRQWDLITASRNSAYHDSLANALICAYFGQPIPGSSISA
jgi:hypothetical protein